MSSQTDLKCWVILRCFRDYCCCEGWTDGEDGDWYKVGGVYHVFVWARTLSLPTFKAVAERRELSIREEDGWKVRKVRCIAFISGGVPEEIPDYIQTHRAVSHRVILYDINQSKKIGAGNSPVFKEFERFLRKRYGVELKPI